MLCGSRIMVVQFTFSFFRKWILSFFSSPFDKALCVCHSGLFSFSKIPSYSEYSNVDEIKGSLSGSMFFLLRYDHLVVRVNACVLSVQCLLFQSYSWSVEGWRSPCPPVFSSLFRQKKTHMFCDVCSVPWIIHLFISPFSKHEKETCRPAGAWQRGMTEFIFLQNRSWYRIEEKVGIHFISNTNKSYNEAYNVDIEKSILSSS